MLSITEHTWTGGNSSTSDKWSPWSYSNVGGSDYSSWDVSAYSEESTAAMITLGSIITASAALNIINNMLNSFSSQNIFSLINQIQLIVLIPMLGTYLSLDVIQYITGINFVLWSFSFQSSNDIINSNWLSHIFSYSQRDSYLSSIKLSNGSTLINFVPTIIIFVFISSFHVCIKVLAYILRKYDNENKMKKFIWKVYDYFTFQVYVRFISQIYLVSTISSMSEIYNADVFSAKPHSEAFAILVLLFLLFVIGFAFLLLIRSKNTKITENPQKRYWTQWYSDVHDKWKHRSFFLLFYIRRMLFWIIVIWFKSFSISVKIGLFAFTQFWYLLYTVFARPLKETKDQITDNISEVSFFSFILLLSYFNIKERWGGIFSSIYLWSLISWNLPGAIISLGNVSLQYIIFRDFYIILLISFFLFLRILHISIYI